ncbi:hypothetical protein RUND412_008217, partial [Rhizina undulata]
MASTVENETPAQQNPTTPSFRHARSPSIATMPPPTSASGVYSKLDPVVSEKQPVMLGAHESRHQVESVDDYFCGPMDPTKHRKLPLFLRLHGSIVPKLLVPLTFVTIWSTAVTAIDQEVHPLAVDSVLLTVLGFVVGLSLSFRSSTAYERYSEGRKFWAQMILHARNLSRIMWVHVKEREGEEGKDDLLCKLTAINLIMAFCQAVKHKLRHEPEYDYEDLRPYIDNLNTFAKTVHKSDIPISRNHRATTIYEFCGEYLGVSFFQNNPQERIKKAAKQGKHHGNLPLEIMTYLSSYVDYVMTDNKTMTIPVMHTQVMQSMLMMMDAYGGCERVLGTPLPVAYNIAIAQITWLYILILPFQLVSKLDWIAIPGTIVAAYIILGLAAIGREIENPFGRDVNDLDLDRYCQQLQMDLNVLTAAPAPNVEAWIRNDKNRPLLPLSSSGWKRWNASPIEEIRQSLARKADQLATQLATDGPEDSTKRVDSNG